MTPVSAIDIVQRILVVEDYDDAREMLRQVLAVALQLKVDAAANGAEALTLLEQRAYSVVVTDLRMPQMSGMQLIEEIQRRQWPVTVIVTTGHGSIADAVKAMQSGAYNFLTKPVDPQHLTLLVQRALQERLLQDEIASLRHTLHERYAFRDILSRSPRMHAVFDLIGQIAETNSTVMIVGETGTGKEIIARAIHDASPARRERAIVAVNCAALSETLLESELFGHEKGSFTGATTQRRGRFEQAHGGTLFLDEIGDVPKSMQVKLLRVLQERRIERVGGTEPIDIDVRLVTATHRSLEKLVAAGTFREDLYYRLNVIKMELPPLRERPEDIHLLARHFVHKYRRPSQPNLEIGPEAMRLLLDARWPGNVRQLENAIERACVTVRGGAIGPEHLPGDLHMLETKPPATVVRLDRPLAELLHESTARIEADYLRAAMAQSNGHVGRCAELCGLSRRSITEKLSHYGIDKREFKSVGEPAE